MPWKTEGWHATVSNPHPFDNGDDAHADARRRAVAARRKVAVYHGVERKRGGVRWTKTAIYGMGGQPMSGNPAWRPIAERDPDAPAAPYVPKKAAPTGPLRVGEPPHPG